MNVLAEEHGFLVVYPGQAANANRSKCWNWFRAEDQDRDRGEPSLIAGITREVAKTIESMSVASSSPGCPPERLWPLFSARHPYPDAAVGAHQAYLIERLTTCPRPSARCKLPVPFRDAEFADETRGRPRPAYRVPIIVFHGDSTLQ